MANVVFRRIRGRIIPMRKALLTGAATTAAYPYVRDKSVGDRKPPHFSKVGPAVLSAILVGAAFPKQTAAVSKAVARWAVKR